MKKTTIPQNASELEKRIDKYFKSRLCVQHTKNGELLLDKKGKPIMKPEIPATLTGLALALGLDSREALNTFEDEEMARLVRRAVMKIEEYAEEKLFSKESGVKLFLSVNFNRWQDSDSEDGDDEYTLPEEVKKWSV